MPEITGKNMKRLNIISASSDKSEALIRSYLANHQSGVLATSDMVGTPHSAVIYYYLDDDLSLLMSTKQETQKYKNLLDNTSFSMTIYDEAKQSALTITGHAEAVREPDDIQLAIDNMNKQSQVRSGRKKPPLSKLIAGDYTAFRLVPLVIKLALYERSTNDNFVETLILAI